MGKKNEAEKVYKTDSGEPIEHNSDSLYNEVTVYFSRIENLFDIMEGFDTPRPDRSPESYFYSFADLGRTILKDVQQQFNRIYDFIEKEIGDIQIDSDRKDTLLRAYIEKRDSQ
jgi:hypothetical protein